MKDRTQFRRLAFAIAALLALGALAAAQPGEAATPPAGKTYFVLTLGLATDATEAYELGAGCLSFGRDEVCDTDGDCGAWWQIEEETRLARQWAAGFEFDLIDDETGLPVHIEGRGRIDGRGRKSSFGAVALGVEETSGATINFAFAGRAVGSAKCERLVTAFEAGQEEAQGGQQ